MTSRSGWRVRELTFGARSGKADVRWEVRFFFFSMCGYGVRWWWRRLCERVRGGALILGGRMVVWRFGYFVWKDLGIIYIYIYRCAHGVWIARGCWMARERVEVDLCVRVHADLDEGDFCRWWCGLFYGLWWGSGEKTPMDWGLLIGQGWGGSRTLVKVDVARGMRGSRRSEQVARRAWALDVRCTRGACW